MLSMVWIGSVFQQPNPISCAIINHPLATDYHINAVSAAELM